MYFANSVGLLGCMKPAGLGCSVVCKYFPSFQCLFVLMESKIILDLHWVLLVNHFVFSFPLQPRGILLVSCKWIHCK